MRRLLVVLGVVAAAVAVGVSAGNAAFPGINGLIVVDAWTGSSQDIATFDPATREVHYIVRTASGSEHEPRASADGKKIVYVRGVQEEPTTPAGPADIWVMNADGTGQTQLTNNALDEQIPMFASDGRILFTRIVDGPRGGDIWIMNGDGSGQKNLTDLDGWQGFPSVSPDGQKVAYESCPVDDWCQIWVMRLDGTTKRQLTFSADWNIHPDWSPSGNQILFLRVSQVGSSYPNSLMVMKTNGTNIRTLYSNPPEVLNYPQWSPDGTKITYTSNNGEPGTGNIFILDLASGETEQVLTPAPPREYAFGYPGWIPNGKKTR